MHGDGPRLDFQLPSCSTCNFHSSWKQNNGRTRVSSYVHYEFKSRCLYETLYAESESNGLVNQIPILQTLAGQLNYFTSQIRRYYLCSVTNVNGIRSKVWPKIHKKLVEGTESFCPLNYRLLRSSVQRTAYNFKFENTIVKSFGTRRKCEKDREKEWKRLRTFRSSFRFLTKNLKTFFSKHVHLWRKASNL